MSVQTSTLPIVPYQSWEPKLALIYLCVAVLVITVDIAKEILIRVPEDAVTNVQIPTLPFTLYQSWKSRLLWALGGALLVYVTAVDIIVTTQNLIWKIPHHPVSNTIAILAFFGVFCLGLLFFSMCFQTACYLKLDTEGPTYCHFWRRMRLKWSEVTDIELVHQPKGIIKKCARVKYVIHAANQYPYTKVVYINDMHGLRHKELVLLMQSVRSKAARLA